MCDTGLIKGRVMLLNYFSRLNQAKRRTQRTGGTHQWAGASCQPGPRAAVRNPRGASSRTSPATATWLTVSATSACPGNLYTQAYLLFLICVVLSSLTLFLWMKKTAGGSQSRNSWVQSPRSPHKVSQPRNRLRSVMYNFTLMVIFYPLLITDLPVLQPLTCGPLVWSCSPCWVAVTPFSRPAMTSLLSLKSWQYEAPEKPSRLPSHLVCMWVWQLTRPRLGATVQITHN